MDQTIAKNVNEYFSYKIEVLTSENEFGKISGKIISNSFREEDETVIGTLSAILMFNPTVSEMDNELHELQELARAAYRLDGVEIGMIEMINSDELFSDVLDEANGETINFEYLDRMVWIDRISIDPKYYGRKLGLGLIKRMMQMFAIAPGGLVFLKPR